MAGYTSKPIAATPLISNGTSNGAVAIADVTGWQVGSQVSLSDNTTTAPFYATIVGITPSSNILWLRQDRAASAGWAQLDWPPNTLGQGLAPQLGTNDSKNPTDMSMWTTGSGATVAQISTFIYSTLVKKTKSSGPSHYFTLTANLLSNTRSTPAFQDTLGNGTQMLLLGPATIRVEPNGIRQETAATNLLYYSQLIGFNDGTNGWTVQGSPTAPTVTTNSADVLAPDGTQTASKVAFPTVANDGSSYSEIYQLVGYSSITESVWLRTLSGTATIYLANNSNTSFYTTCNVTTTWQRFSLPPGGTGAGAIYFILGADTRPGNSRTPGITACTVYAWGAQAETTAFPTSYFPTNTNVLPLSAGIGWGNARQSGATVTGTANTTDVLAPDGTQTAGKLVYSAVTAGNYANWESNGYLTGAFGCVASVWLRTLSGTAIVPWSIYTGPNGSFTVTSTWTKFSAVGTNPGAQFLLGADSAAAGGQTMSACTVYAWGGQLEFGSQPSSTFITGSSVTTTRAADVQTLTNPLASINPVNWSFGATLTPLSTWANIATAASNTAYVLQAWNGALANSYVFNVTSGTNINANLWDASANPTVLGSPVSGSTPVVYSYFNNAGSQSDIPSGALTTSTGTGIISTQGPTLTLGNGNNVYNFQGWYKNVWMDKNNTLTVSKLSLFLNGVVPSAAIGAGTLLTDQGVAVTNVRATPAFCDISATNNYSSMKLMAPNTLSVEANGLRVEGAVQNFIYYSNLVGFNDGTNGWTNTGTTVTTNTSDVLAPDGTQTASKIVVPLSTGSSQNMTWQISSDSAAHNYSVWLRVLSGTQTVYIGTRSAGGYQACSVTTTWQRFTFPGNTSAYFYIGYDGFESGDPGGPGYTVYAWGAQSEGVPSAPIFTSYFPTNTNTILNAGQLCAGASDAGGGGTGTSTLNTTDVTDPTGGNSATKLVLSATTGGGTQYAFWTIGTPVVGVSSIWARCATGTNSITVFDGSGVHTTVLNLTTAWQRFTVTNFSANAFCVGSYVTGIPGGTVYVWGAQSEPGTQPSSTFITGSSITTTRAADYPSVPSPYAGLSNTVIPTWRYGVSAKPLGTWAQVFGVSNLLVCLLNVGENNAANCTRLELVDSSASQLDMYDSADANHLVNASSGPSGSSTYTLEAYGTGSTAGTFTIPGAGAISGAGTGIVSIQPAKVHLGQFGANITNYPIWGWITNVYVDQGPT